MHPDERAMWREEESRQREFQSALYCPKCGNKRLSVNGQWRCYGCDGAPQGGVSMAYDSVRCATVWVPRVARSVGVPPNWALWA